MRVLIDCDPGHDDIIAILIALAHPETFTILGLTTVAGNQTVDKVTDNLLRVLDHLGVSIPVAKGCAMPIRRLPEPQPGAHGTSGMDGPVLPEAVSTPVALGAVPFLYQTIMQQEAPVTIIELAPMTNLALLLQYYPEVKTRIAAVHMMGGSLYSGNILARAEFNLYHDPEAARIVFRSGIPIVMSGLEVCGRARTYFCEYAPLKAGGKASVLTYELLEFFSGYCRRQGKDYTTVFDAVPVIHLLEPGIFRSGRHNIDIETEGELCRGMTAEDAREAPDIENGVTVLEDVDQRRYMELLVGSIRKLDDLLKKEEKGTDGVA